MHSQVLLWKWVVLLLLFQFISQCSACAPGLVNHTLSPSQPAKPHGSFLKRLYPLLKRQETNWQKLWVVLCIHLSGPGKRWAVVLETQTLGELQDQKEISETTCKGFWAFEVNNKVQFFKEIMILSIWPKSIQIKLNLRSSYFLRPFTALIIARWYTHHAHHFPTHWGHMDVLKSKKKIKMVSVETKYKGSYLSPKILREFYNIK